MTKFVLTYDVRAKNHDYQPLYELLAAWGAAHLQNSVWLADLNGTASAVRDAMQAKMHADDTIGVLELANNGGWATRNARQTGVDWLKAKVAA